MKAFSNFHDGFLDGIWIPSENTVNVFVRTLNQTRSVIVGEGVTRLQFGGFREGNIILDVTIHEGTEISASDIIDVYDVDVTYKPDWQHQTLQKAQEGLKLLAINPSFGGSCLILAESFDFVDWKSWCASLNLTSLR